MKKLRGERKQDAMDGAKFCGVAAAIVGSAVVGGVTSSVMSNKASKAQQQAAGSANAEAAREYDITRQDQLNLLTQQRADQQPWLDAGRNALTQLVSGTAAGGQFTKTFTGADLASDPGYQFRLQQGQQGVKRSAAAQGGLLSGAALKAMARFSQGLASDEYGAAYNRFNNDQSTQYNRLASLAGVGQQATNQVGQASQNAYGTIANAGMNTSNAIQNNLTGAGNARASGYVGVGNAINNGLGQAYNGYQQNQLLGLLNRQNQLSIANRSADPIASMNAQNGWTS